MNSYQSLSVSLYAEQGVPERWAYDLSAKSA